VRQRSRRLGAQAIEGEREVAPPELRREPSRGLDHPTELPDEHLDVRRRKVGAKRSLLLGFRHELLDQRSNALAGGGLLLGSVSHRCTLHAHRPVLIVPALVDDRPGACSTV
jgi:hypothetical protein